MMKLQDAITRFYRRCSAMGVSNATIINYRYQAKAMLKFFYAKEIFFVENITPDDIRAYLAYMRDYGYAPDTIRDRYNGLNTLFNFLCEDGVLVQNPMKPVKKPKLPKIPARTFTTTELQKILGYYKENTFTGLRNKCILYILFSTGIRRAELLGLTMFSLHLDEGVMDIIGKGNKQRIVPITPHLEKIIRKYIKARAERLLDLQVETSAFLIGKWGKPLTVGGLRELFRELKEGTDIGKSNAKRISPHTFRHTCIKNLLLNGCNLYFIKRLLGHSDLSVTEVYLDHVNTQDMYNQMKEFSPIENSKWSYLG